MQENLHSRSWQLDVSITWLQRLLKTERDGWLYSEMMAYLPLGMVYEVRDATTPAALAEVVAYVVFAISPLLFFIF